MVHLSVMRHSCIESLLSGSKVHVPPNALMVITANQLEIVANGKYKSSVHRAALYSMAKRISLTTGNGPSLDEVIRPAPELVNESHPPGCSAVTYREFFEMHQRKGFDKKSALDFIRIFFLFFKRNPISLTLRAIPSYLMYHFQQLYTQF